MHFLRTCAGALCCALILMFAAPAEARRHPNGHDCLAPKRVDIHTTIDGRNHRAVGWSCRRLRSVAIPFPKPKQKEAVAIDAPGARPTGASAGLLSDEVSARRPYRHHRHRHRAYHHAPANLITISTAGGNITVAASHADKFRGFIGDAVARGFRGPISCYARGGHRRGSLHYRGEACDFAQRGWNRTVRLMYRVGDLAAKWGLRDGCSFRDCGHIDTGARLARHGDRRLVARVRSAPW